MRDRGEASIAGIIFVFVIVLLYEFVWGPELAEERSKLAEERRDAAQEAIQNMEDYQEMLLEKYGEPDHTDHYQSDSGYWSTSWSYWRYGFSVTWRQGFDRPIEMSIYEFTPYLESPNRPALKP